MAMRRRPFRRSFSRRGSSVQRRFIWAGLSSLSPTPLTTTLTAIYLVDQATRDAYNFNDATVRGGYINISAYAAAAGPANFSTMAFNLVATELDATDSVPASMLTELDPSLVNWQDQRNVLWHWHGMVAGNMNGVAASYPTYIREQVKSKRRLTQGDGLVLLASSNNPTASEVFWTYSVRFALKL